MAGQFYPPPSVYVGGRQPFAPALGIAQSGPTPDNPPRRSLAALGIIFSSWVTVSVPLPAAAKIAPLIPAAAAASNVPAPNRANFGIVQQHWQRDPVTVIYVCSIAPLLQTPAVPDQPPATTRVVFNSILNQWYPVHRPLQRLTTIASVAPAAPVPDQPPVPGRVTGGLIRQMWEPPWYALPEAGTLAPFIPAPVVPDQPPAIDRASLRLILDSWKAQPFIYPPLADIAPLMPVAAATGPPGTSLVNLHVILRQSKGVAWDYANFIAGARAASFIAPPVVPDAPPVISYANRNLLLASWIPPYVPIPALRISVGATKTPPELDAQLPSLNAAAETGSHTYALGDSFSGATSFSISPSVEAGWNFSSLTGSLTIDTDDANTFGPYVITATNENGSIQSNGFSITVVQIDVRPRFKVRRSR